MRSNLTASHPEPQQAEQFQERVLDAAIAKRIPVDKPTALTALIRQVDSRGLQAIVETDSSYSVTKEDIKSKPFQLEFHIGADGTRHPAEIVLRIDSSGFEPESQQMRIAVPPEGDSEICTFLPTPKRTGEIILSLELYKEDIHIIKKPLVLRTQSQLSAPLVFFFNLMIIGAFALAFYFQGRMLLPLCVYPEVGALIWGVILVMLGHLVWRNLRGVIIGLAETIVVGVVKVPLRALGALFDTIHLWMLSNRVLSISALVVFGTAGIFGWSPLSPFRLPDATPIIESFSVRYPGGVKGTYLPGDEIQIINGQRVLVEAMILQPASALCDWSVLKGTLLPAQGCSTQYSVPLTGNVDSLTVYVQSQCRRQSAYESLHIEVVP